MPKHSPVVGSISLLALASGLVVLMDVLRVWLPSLITIFGQAGTTPAGQMGAFALVWFLAGPALVVPLARARTRLVPLGAAIVLVGTRVALQLVHGDSPQLYIASVGLLAGIVWLTAVAVQGPAGPLVARGVAIGLAAAVTIHTALGTVDLVWRGDAWARILVVLELCAFLNFEQMRTAAHAPSKAARPAPAAGWLMIGPALLLTGVVTGSPSRAEAAAGWPYALPGLIIVAGAWLGVFGALAYRTVTRRPYVAGLALVVLVTLAVLPRTTSHGIVGLLPGWTVLAQALGAAALGTCLGWAGSGSAASARRSGAAAAGGMLIFVLLTFGYYAAYDISYGFPNTVFLLVTAVVIACAVRPETVRAVVHRRVFGLVGLAAGIACAVAVTGVLLGPDAREAERTAAGSPTASPDPSGVRIVTYNVRMGFDLAGRFAVRRAANAVKAQHPDVVVLNEVDRGWFLNGGHDMAGLLSAELDMPYVFAPATDAVWGDAVLSRYPVTGAHSSKIAPSDAPTGASVLGVGLDLGGATLNVVATHLQPGADGTIPVTEAAKANAAARAMDGPVVMLGDMNAEPGSPQFAALSVGLRDGLADARPVATFPADHPVQQIDQVLVTPDIRVDDITVPATTASDHRPVAVTVRFRTGGR